mmetsp:Transcript_33424/g.104176  ORF Transcript_33424/g.104176 Transcript_33424/m.104176 type:complete len:244 (-) Transcript_33424:3259-3990(-)
MSGSLTAIVASKADRPAASRHVGAAPAASSARNTSARLASTATRIGGRPRSSTPWLGCALSSRSFSRMLGTGAAAVDGTLIASRTRDPPAGCWPGSSVMRAPACTRSCTSWSENRDRTAPRSGVSPRASRRLASAPLKRRSRTRLTALAWSPCSTAPSGVSPRSSLVLQSACASIMRAADCARPRAATLTSGTLRIGGLIVFGRVRTSMVSSTNVAPAALRLPGSSKPRNCRCSPSPCLRSQV